jgi:hypothetical protein
MIIGLPVTVEVLRDFDFFYKGEIAHASQGKRLQVMKPDADTLTAIDFGFVKEITSEQETFETHQPNSTPVSLVIDGDMPQLAIRPNAKDWDSATMIRRAMETYKDNPPDKAITIFLWDVDGKYDTVFFNSGLSIMQAVALLEHIKYDLLKQMDNTAQERQHGKETEQPGTT